MMKRKKGFTLAELLVVVAIIAILIAVSIAIFAGKREEAKKAVCDANRVSIKEHIVTDYLSGKSETLDADVLKRYMDKNRAYCPDDGEFSVVGDFENGFYIKCSVHDDDGGGSGGGGTFSGENLKKLWDSLLESDKEYFSIAGKLVDSGADSVRRDKVLSLMKQYGIDPTAEGAATWAIESRSGKSAVIYWTGVDIQGLSPGSVNQVVKSDVPTIRYNVKTGNYSVWTVNLAKKDNEYGKYNGIAGEGTQIKLPEGQAETYENAMAVYLKALEEYNKKH